MQGRGLVRFRAGYRGLSGTIVIAPESLGTDALVLVGKAYKGRRRSCHLEVVIIVFSETPEPA